MIKPLATPNIPQGKVKTVAVGSDDLRLLKALDYYGISVIKTIESPNLDKRVSCHTDMLLLNIADNLLFIDETQNNNIVNFLTIGYSVKKIKTRVKSPYPKDSSLNSLVLGDKFIYCPTAVCDEALNCAYEYGYKLISVKQGYVKCSVCPLSLNAAITDDESIYKALTNNGIDCLYISKGSVKLNGFDYGFIGGCTGLIDKDKLLFNGDISMHSDYIKIEHFLNEHSITPITIKGRALADIGSIIPLCEEIP